jgi:hypothetical protein
MTQLDIVDGLNHRVGFVRQALEMLHTIHARGAQEGAPDIGLVLCQSLDSLREAQGLINQIDTARA